MIINLILLIFSLNSFAAFDHSGEKAFELEVVVLSYDPESVDFSYRDHVYRVPRRDALIADASLSPATTQMKIQFSKSDLVRFKKFVLLHQNERPPLRIKLSSEAIKKIN